MRYLTGICLQQLFQISVLSLFLFALPENRLESVVVVVGATIYLYLLTITAYQRLLGLENYIDRMQLLRTLLPVLNRRLTSVVPEDDALQLKPTGKDTFMSRMRSALFIKISEDEEWAAFQERHGNAFLTSDTLKKVDRVLNSSQSRPEKLDKMHRLLDEEMDWVNLMAIPELVRAYEQQWRASIPVLRRAASASYIRNGCFVGQCGLVLLKAATLL